MTISLIVAVAENGVIGKNNQLVWHMPTDMKYFMDKTKGHCVITGRKNYESIPDKYRPLSNRTNIVVTRQKNYPAPGAFTAGSIDEAIKLAKESHETECFVIGGAEIYRQTLKIADIIYYTKIHHSFEGDAFFPEIDINDWEEKSSEFHPADERNSYDFSFIVYSRKNK